MVWQDWLLGSLYLTALAAPPVSLGFAWWGWARQAGFQDPKWRAIRDDDGRIMVLIGFNMHIGDAWEHADDPYYPERFSSLAYRLGINYIIYGMTH